MRRDPWPGWQRLLEVVRAEAPADLAVLDVGCGHGRFTAYLDDALGRPCRYLGVDASAPLLAHARSRSYRNVAPSFVRAELLHEPLAELRAAPRFSLAVLFGVLHHVPSERLRASLLAAIASRLAPGGLLALTSWQFEAFDRFREKLVPWDEWNRRARTPIDPSELEPGDHLLPWGRGETVRYCHFSADQEVRGLLGGLPLRLLTTYASDGRGGILNRYYVLRAG